MQHKWTPEETARFLAEGNKLAQRDGIRCRGCEHCTPLCGEAYERGRREATADIVTWLRAEADWERARGQDPKHAYSEDLLARRIERGEHIAKADEVK